MDARDAVFLIVVVLLGIIWNVAADNNETDFQINPEFYNAYCSNNNDVLGPVSSDLFCAHKCSLIEDVAGCPDPGEMSNALLNAGDTLEGAERIYTCTNDYITNTGSSTITVTCTSTGQWSTSSETCLRSCGSPPVVEHGTVELGTIHEGSVRTLTCDSSYSVKLNGVISVGSQTGSVTCQSNGEWDSVECVLDCPEPGAYEHATLNTWGITDEAVRTYTCWNHYITNTGLSTITVTCTSTGQWSTPSETCLRSCNSPPVVQHWTVGSGTVHEGSVRTLTCDTTFFFSFNGFPSVDIAGSFTCHSNGEWDNVDCVLA